MVVQGTNQKPSSYPCQLKRKLCPKTWTGESEAGLSQGGKEGDEQMGHEGSGEDGGNVPATTPEEGNRDKDHTFKKGKKPDF